MAENPSDLVGKEFIFEYGLDRIIPPSEKTGGVFAIEQMVHRRERVVRCKDCECFMSDDDTGCWCVRLNREVGPRGFCAWGEPRVVSE